MTVIICVFKPSTHKNDSIKPFFAAQNHFGEELDQKHKFPQTCHTNGFGWEILISMNNVCDKDEMNGSGKCEIVSLDCSATDASHDLKLRMVGRRKNGQQRNGKQKKGDGGNGYGRKGGGQRRRRGSQGNGSSGMEGSGEGSGNGDESSDDDDDDDDDCDDENDEEDERDEEDDEEEEEEEEEDEMEEEIEEDTDNVSPMIEDEMEETTNGSVDSQPVQRSLELKRLEFENPGPKVASGTLDLKPSGNMKGGTDIDPQSTVGSAFAPATPGTPVTLSGVIWKETMGGVLVVNLKWRNKIYSGSLIDHSRHGWATPRNLEEANESNLSASKRGKGRKGKLKGSAYTGNPLSPKMTGSGKRGPRFHHDKGKHGKDSFVRPRTKRSLGSDNTEGGTRTRRRSCTVKTSISPSPSPTPLIECPERNCNKKYKHINGLRYHQAHAHLDSVADADEKESDEEEEIKSHMKEPLSAHSKSSGSDDVKPLSSRKTKGPKHNSSNNEKINENASEKVSIKSEDICGEVDGAEGKCDLTKVKIEQQELVKTVAENGSGSVPNILEEAVKIIFDESTGAESTDITCNTDVVHPGMFAGMNSQPMVSLHSGECKDVSYEAVAQTMAGPIENNPTNMEEHDVDITVKEEVIEEGNAGMAKVTNKDETHEAVKIENMGGRFIGEKSGGLTMENFAGVVGTDKTKWNTDKGVKSANNNRKSVPGDGMTVTKETNQLKTSAAEIRSLPGYQHFRLSSNNFSGSVSHTSDEKGSKSLDTRLLTAKDPQKSITGLKWDSGGIPRLKGPLEKQENAGIIKNSIMWTMQATPSTSSPSYQLSYESKHSLIRPGYISVAASKKPTARSVVTASTTWVPEVHPAVAQRMTGGSLPGQEVLPMKTSTTPETSSKSKTENGSREQEEDERTKTELSKPDEERPKAVFAGKPARAVGVAHPFNAEKSEGQFAVGSIGSFSSVPVKALYSKSSSPKISVDHTLPETTEVKKVRVEKTLEVPVGEVLPQTKTSRSAVSTIETRDAVIMGSKETEQYSGVHVASSDTIVRQPVDADSPQNDIIRQPPYIPTVADRSSPWRPTGRYSPPTETGPRSLRDRSQRYTSTETRGSPLRETIRRSPIREVDRASPFRSNASGSLAKDIGKRLVQEVSESRLPFVNFDERSSHREKTIGMPFREMGGRSPEKDTSRRLPPRITGEKLTYRDSDRRSPPRETPSSGQLRDYDRSPLRDGSHSGWRSPVREHLHRSPDHEFVHRASYRDTSPNASNRDIAYHSPYRDAGRIKQARDGESLPQRRDARSPENESTMVDGARGHVSKTEAKATKEATESAESQNIPSAENKFSRLSEEEAMMLHLRQQPFYQFQTMPQDSATREAMENYMMYLSRLPAITAAIDPRILQAYPMLSPAAQMSLLLQPPKETAATKEERSKDVSEEVRSKSGATKNESQRNRGLPFSESSDVELVVNKRHYDGGGSSSSKGTEKNEYDSTPSKRTKASEPKDVHEIIDNRHGSRIQFKKLEHQVLQQKYQHKMDALNQLQAEKTLKQKAELKNSSRSKASSGTGPSRLKSGIESRATSKKEDPVFSTSTNRSHEKDKGTPREEKSRLSPTTRQNLNTANESEQSRTSSRNSENKSPPSGTYQSFLTGQNLPANHGLSNSFEQAALAMQGIPSFMIPPPFPLSPGIMMSNPLVGAQFHSAVTSRNLDSKREPSRSSSTATTGRGRAREEENHELDKREHSSQTKKDLTSSSKTNSNSPPPKQNHDKEGSRRTKEYDEETLSTLRDNPSFHGPQTLPANLAFRRGNMSAVDPGHFNQAFPRMMYSSSPGNFRTPFENPYVPYSRK